jgi:hypothetical protein
MTSLRSQQQENTNFRVLLMAEIDALQAEVGSASSVEKDHQATMARQA